MQDTLPAAMHVDAKCWCRERTVSVLRKHLVWSPTGQYSSVLTMVLHKMFAEIRLEVLPVHVLHHVQVCWDVVKKFRK